jgi:hypothetical protein
MNDRCEISRANRRVCSACRLAKCFHNGMMMEMVRATRSKQQVALRSQFVVDIVQMFDRYCDWSHIEQFIRSQQAFPVKVRFKCFAVAEFYNTLSVRFQLIGTKMREQKNARSFVHDADRFTSMIGTLLILNWTSLFDSPIFEQSTVSIFGHVAASLMKQIVAELDADRTLLKLAFAIVSTSMSIPLERFYTELTWHYLLDQVGNDHAIRSFSHLIRCLLLIHQVLAEIAPSILNNAHPMFLLDSFP